MTARGPTPPADLRAPWQIEQAAKCSCRGTDDMCPCQNVDRSQPPHPAPLREAIARVINGWAFEDTRSRTINFSRKGDRDDAFAKASEILDLLNAQH